MNDLSWMLYWADVAPQLSKFLAVIGFLLTVASLVVMGFHFSYRDDTRTDYVPETNEHFERYSEDARIARNLWWSKITFPLFLLLCGSSFLVPSKTTFYMIAASEAGEQAVQTPEFARIRAVINNWLDEHGPAPDADSAKAETQ